jgi:hypothetical protein
MRIEDEVPEGYWDALTKWLKNAPTLPEPEPFDEPEPLL